MKNMMITALVTLASAAAFATPAVGDNSLFNVKIEQNGAVINGTFEISLIGKDDAGAFKQKTVVTLEGQQSQTNEEVVKADQFLDDAQISGILANCESGGGKSSTYTAGEVNVNVCIIPTKDDAGNATGEVYVGAVPFGVAKQVSIDSKTGRTTTLELQKYTNGK